MHPGMFYPRQVHVKISHNDNIQIWHHGASSGSQNSITSPSTALSQQFIVPLS